MSKALSFARRSVARYPRLPRFVEKSFAFIIFVAFALVFFRRAWHGIWFLPWADELVHLLGGWALSSGDRLYSTFVDLHGPLIFAIAKAYSDLFGWSNPNYIRLVPIIFMILATVTVLTCQSFTLLQQRLWSAGLFVGIVTTIWIVQGLYLFEYYLISAALLVMMLALYVIPRWSGSFVGTPPAFIAGFSAGLAVFTSHAFLPSVFSFYVSANCVPRTGMGRRSALAALTGFMVATLCFIIWLARFGDIRGFIAFHVVFAHTAYQTIIHQVSPEFTIWGIIRSLTPSVAPDRRVQDVGIVAVVTGTFTGWRIYPRFALIFGVIGILGLDARGDLTFQDATFVVVSVAFAALTVGHALQGAGKIPVYSAFTSLAVLASVAGIEIFMRGAIGSPLRLTRKMIENAPVSEMARPDGAPEYALIRALVRPDERILALVYRPWEYWFASRLPMRGFYMYLPYDALYARNPVLGVQHDLCPAMQKDPPPVVLFDNWKVWDHFAPADYMPCVIDILRQGYTVSSLSRELYIRNDRVPIHSR